MRYLILIFLAFNTSSTFAQSKHYSGTWTKINTTYAFDFELILNVNESNEAEGYFTWKVIHYDENDPLSKQYYQSKIGMTGTEYVSGTYNSLGSEYFLKGYKKEDPNAIIGLDVYQLKVDAEGNIWGITEANNTWLGRINAQLQDLVFFNSEYQAVFSFADMVAISPSYCHQMD